MNNINVYLRKDYVKTNGETSVMLKIYVMSKAIKINTGVLVNPNLWNVKSKRVSDKHPDSKDLNLIIDSCKSRVSDIFVRYRLKFQELTPNIFKREYQTPSTYKDFYDFMEKSLMDKRGMITENTYISHRSLMRKMQEFKQNLMFTDITEDFINDLKKYFKITHKNGANTIHKNIGTLKAYLNLAIRKKIILENPLKNLKSKRTKPDRVYLNEAELIKFVKHYSENTFPQNIHSVLRLFLFSCFTGLRLSDVKALKHENLINDIIVLRPKKLSNVNGEICSIPLCNPAKVLIKDESKVKLFGTIFFAYSDQVTNRLLKKIADTLEINKNLSFHASRHTFATMYLEKNPGDVATLQQLMGHSKIEQTMVYVHINEKSKIERMKVFDNYL